jgi:ssDNA-binding replication factor A large subunit
VTNVWIGDETGKIKLCLWDKQVDAVAVGDTIQIKNANVASFMGERQVRLGKSGTLSVLRSRAASIAPQAKNISKDGNYS